MRGLPSALYSACAYTFFLATFVHAIGFVEGLTPKAIDTGHADHWLPSLAINTLLLGVFAVQHSVMARPAFKRVWTRFVPAQIERSTYVVFASAALALLMWQWRPLPDILWSIDTAGLRIAITAISWAGWGLVLMSTFLISHFHLFGLSQGFARLLKLAPESSEAHLVTPLFYRWVRHPLYAGFVIAFWATPDMSVGHLVFAAATTAYILIGIQLEERDLLSVFGDRYRIYRAKVGMLFPKIRKPHNAMEQNFQ